MDILCIMALILVGTCNGTVLLIYQEGEEKVSLPSCKGDGWQIDYDQDNAVNCYLNCSAEDKETCGNRVRKQSTREPCQITLEGKKGGFFACVKNSSFKERVLHPFDQSTNQIYSYIVALIDPKLTSSLEVATQSVTKRTGEQLKLSCTLNILSKYDANTVFWIKTNGGRSSCIYSCTSELDGQQFDSGCHIDGQLLERRSNYSSKLNAKPAFHHITISNLTHTDDGQYVCAIQASENEEKRLWKVIANITVSVETPLKVLQGDCLIPLYVVSSLLLVCLLVAAIVIIVRKKTNIYQQSHIKGIKRDQDGEETLDSECSPYAVGMRDDVIYSLAGLPEGREPVATEPVATALGEDKQAGLSPVMVDNTLYETSPMDPHPHQH